METMQKRGQIKDVVLRLLIMAGLLFAASAIGLVFRHFDMPRSNIANIYLLAVLLTARFTPGYLSGFLMSLIAAFAFNFFFMVPYFTLTVNAPSYITTFLIMTVTSVVTSALTSYAKQNALKAQEMEAETKTLYALTNRLTAADELADVAGIAAQAAGEALGMNAACLCLDENEMPERTFVQREPSGGLAERETSGREALAEKLRARKTGVLAGEEFHDWPIRGREMALGLIRIPKADAERLGRMQARLLQSITETTALAMDRLRSAQQKSRLNAEAAQERYRSNLLRAISHDLRTPLSGIMGTSEIILGMTGRGDPRYAFAEGILTEARWLHALIENILSLTRLQEDGTPALRRQPEAAEEIVGEAVRHAQARSPGREITVDVPAELLMVPMDARLIQQVLLNLLDNAAKFTPPGKNIGVTLKKDGERGCAVFCVRDEGEGIDPEDFPNIFKMFYTTRSKHSDAQPGLGLGLSICEAIVKAHGGGITAKNRTDETGAEFEFTLPLEPDGPGAPKAEGRRPA